MNVLRSAQTAQVAGRSAARGVASRPCSRSRRAPFSGSRAPRVQTAAAAADAAGEGGQQQQQGQRQRRAPRQVTVQLETLQPGQELDGVVTKIESFGAFVDVGAEASGLVHVSQISDGYVKNVADAVKVGDAVKVRVLSADAAQKRLALTMKGMGRPAGGARGGRGGAGAAEASFEADDAEEAEEDAFPLEAGDMVYEGVVFRVDGEDDGEGYDEADEYEVDAEAEVAAIAALENTAVEGTITSIEDFGVVVEWSDASGAKRSGLLHVSEMLAPASAAAAELGADGAGDEAEEDGAGDAGLLADEAEFEGDMYVDVGGIDKPGAYYKAGDKISAYVLSVEGGKISLTQDIEALALDDAVDEEGEAEDFEEERLLAKADGEDGVDIFAGRFPEDEEGEEIEVDIPNASDTTASIYYGQAAGAAKTAAAGAFIRGKAGAAVSPAGFPSRGMAVADADLRVPAARRLVDIDDAGDEAELVDYWSDDLGSLSKRRMASLGAKIAPSEEGELAVVAAEGGGDESSGDAGALELLAGVTDAELDALVDAILGDDVEDEAEVPFLARRNPGSRV